MTDKPLPIAALVARWEKLPADAQAYARGYMGRAVDCAAAALDVAEQFAAEEAAKSNAAAKRLKGAKLRVVR